MPPPADAGRSAMPWMSADQKRDLLLRLRTAHAHLTQILAMVEADAASPEVMQQVGAVQASLERVNRILLRREAEVCLGAAATTPDGRARVDAVLKEFPFAQG